MKLSKEQQRYLDKNIPDLYNGSYKRTYSKAMTSKSLKAAINSKCLDCACWQRGEIADCLVTTCPLYPHRPYRS